MAKFERQLGRFVFATNSPFSIVENKEFASLMELARPGIAVPGRRALGGRILDVVYDEEWTKFGQQVPRFGNIDIIVIIPLLVWPPKVIIRGELIYLSPNCQTFGRLGGMSPSGSMGGQTS